MHHAGIGVAEQHATDAVVDTVARPAQQGCRTRGLHRLEGAAGAAALLGWAGNSVNDRVGGMLFGDADTGVVHFQPTKDRSALWRLLRETANPARRAQRGINCIEEVLKRTDRGSGTGSLIFVIADFNRDLAGMDKALGQVCQKHSVVLIPVDDPADRELPAVGRALFRDAEGRMVEIDTDDAAGLRAYSERWESRRAALIKLANRLGVAVIPVQTSHDVHLSLMTGLSLRARSRASL